MAQSKGKKRQIIICYRDIGCFYRTQTKAALQNPYLLTLRNSTYKGRFALTKHIKVQ